MKIQVTETYENNFEMEVPDDATEEEIIELISNESEKRTDGYWSSDWQEVREAK